MPSPSATIHGRRLDRSRAAIVDELRRLLPRLESLAAPRALPFGLPALDAHLPHGGLTLGALHEVAPAAYGDVPAAFGFLVALLARRAPTHKPVLLIASARALADHGRPHGHGFQRLGLDPARLILVETRTETQALWAMEEAVRSAVPAAVGGAIEKLDLKTSQRLQLAAGDAGLPLVLLRPAQAREASAAATRWRIGAAEAARDRFGLLVRTRWHARLERCRNGRLGEWLVEFDHAASRFSLAAALADPALPRRADARPASLKRAG
jgi:protein ImuA